MRSGSHSHTCALRRAELGSSQQRGGGTRTLRACFWTVTDDRTYEPGSVRPSCSSEHTHGQVKDLHLRPPRPLEMFLLSPVRLTLFLLVFLDVAHPSLQGRSKGRWNKGGFRLLVTKEHLHASHCYCLEINEEKQCLAYGSQFKILSDLGVLVSWQTVLLKSVHISTNFKTFSEVYEYALSLKYLLNNSRQVLGT
ncbi:roundabout -like protein [Labeo rohita]|uniref:Roundabout-like protein n=1 Tax=Labeo rohita TaxID=84645 RepID=A0A498L9N7_LABRO|nr:roundabout -like protein [Labeo rohita]